MFFTKLLKPNSKNRNYKSCNKKKITAGISLWAAFFCYSQKCDLEFEGQILDLHDNSPIGQATIKVVNSDQTGYSDDEGFFRLKNLCSEDILIKISHLKCNDLFQEVNLICCLLNHVPK